MRDGQDDATALRAARDVHRLVDAVAHDDASAVLVALIPCLGTVRPGRLLYVDRTGVQWRYLPHGFPHRNTVYGSFAKWADEGVFPQFNGLLRQLLREKEGRDAEPSACMIDAQSAKTSTSVPVTGQGIDAGRKTTVHRTAVQAGNKSVCGPCRADDVAREKAAEAAPPGPHRRADESDRRRGHLASRRAPHRGRPLGVRTGYGVTPTAARACAFFGSLNQIVARTSVALSPEGADDRSSVVGLIA